MARAGGFGEHRTRSGREAQRNARRVIVSAARDVGDECRHAVVLLGEPAVSTGPAYAAKALSVAGARVYVDAGHSAWLPAGEAARRLKLVGLEHVAGFALNVSNDLSTEDSAAIGEKVAALEGDVHFVVDTSRNGNGSDDQWCNPPGRALGERPRLLPDGAALDALVWAKRPGEPDGECHGGPAAGQWFDAQALELARGAEW